MFRDLNLIFNLTFNLIFNLKIEDENDNKWILTIKTIFINYFLKLRRNYFLNFSYKNKEM